MVCTNTLCHIYSGDLVGIRNSEEFFGNNPLMRMNYVHPVLKTVSVLLLLYPGNKTFTALSTLLVPIKPAGPQRPALLLNR